MSWRSRRPWTSDKLEKKRQKMMNLMSMQSPGVRNATGAADGATSPESVRHQQKAKEVPKAGQGREKEKVLRAAMVVKVFGTIGEQGATAMRRVAKEAKEGKAARATKDNVLIVGRWGIKRGSAGATSLSTTLEKKKNITTFFK